jgi:biopolymer transport protein ExbB
MDFLNGIVSFIRDGGAWMYPILLVGIVGMAICGERYIALTRIGNANRTLWDQLYPILAAQDFDKARELTTNDKSTISELLNLGLERQGAVRRRDDIEIAMEEGMMEVMPQLQKRTNFVALLANIATLLGLLGTIVGLIQAFNAVANAPPAEKAALLSGSISVAMNTTAMGLIVAVPLLLLHSLISSKASGIITSLEMASVKTLNIISNTSHPRRKD